MDAPDYISARTTPSPAPVEAPPDYIAARIDPQGFAARTAKGKELKDALDQHFQGTLWHFKNDGMIGRMPTPDQPSPLIGVDEKGQAALTAGDQGSKEYGRYGAGQFYQRTKELFPQLSEDQVQGMTSEFQDRLTANAKQWQINRLAQEHQNARGFGTWDYVKGILPGVGTGDEIGYHLAVKQAQERFNKDEATATDYGILGLNQAAQKALDERGGWEKARDFALHTPGQLAEWMMVPGFAGAKNATQLGFRSAMFDLAKRAAVNAPLRTAATTIAPKLSLGLAQGENPVPDVFSKDTLGKFLDNAIFEATGSKSLNQSGGVLKKAVMGILSVEGAQDAQKLLGTSSGGPLTRFTGVMSNPNASEEEKWKAAQDVAIEWGGMGLLEAGLHGINRLSERGIKGEPEKVGQAILEHAAEQENQNASPTVQAGTTAASPGAADRPGAPAQSAEGPQGANGQAEVPANIPGNAGGPDRPAGTGPQGELAGAQGRAEPAAAAAVPASAADLLSGFVRMRDWLGKPEYQSAQGTDANKAIEDMRGRIKDHLERGGTVSLQVDGGRQVPVASVEGNAVRDAKGVPWGLGTLMFEKPGDPQGIHFGAVPERAANDRRKPLEVVTPRQRATALEGDHLAALKQLQDAQRDERNAKNDQALGLNRGAELKRAGEARKTAKTEMSRIARELDKARVEASAAEAQQPSAPPDRDTVADAVDATRALDPRLAASVDSKKDFGSKLNRLAAMDTKVWDKYFSGTSPPPESGVIHNEFLRTVDAAYQDAAGSKDKGVIKMGVRRIERAKELMGPAAEYLRSVNDPAADFYAKHAPAIADEAIRQLRGEPAPGTVERRQDADRRKRLADMSPEEMRKQLLTSPKTELPNRRAFEEAGDSKAVGMSDADGLKALNDKFGYEAGDALLRAKADALKEAGLDAYHDKGDEFLYRSHDLGDLQARLERAREILRARPIKVTMADGTTRLFKGADFSYGAGHDLGIAEKGLKAHKAEREARGERARGELRGITELGPEAGQEDRSASAAKTGGPAQILNDPKALADLVHQAGRELKPAIGTAGTQPWESHKVFLSELYDAIKDKLGGATLDQFKKAMVKAHQAGTVALSRLDLVQAVPPERQAEISRSEAKHLNAMWDLLNVNSEQARAAGSPLNPPKAPDAALQMAHDLLSSESGFVNLPHTAEMIRDATQKVKNLGTHVWDGVKRLGGQMFPTTTRLSREAGEAVADMLGARVFAKYASDHFSDKVLGVGSEEAFDRLVGATLMEMRARHAQEAYRSSGNNEAAAKVVTFVGGANSPLTSEADFQAALANPDVKAALDRYKEHFVPEMEKNFRTSQGLDETDPIDSLTQIPGMPVNALALDKGAPVTPGTVFSGQGNLKNVKLRKNPFSNQATLAAGAYELNLRKIMENSMMKGYANATKAEAYRAMVDNDLGKWDKPGTQVEGFKEVPFTRPPKGTQDATGNEVFYARDEAYNEFRSALQVDQVQGYQKALKSLTQLPTIAALASSAEAAGHSINLLTALGKPSGSWHGGLGDLLHNAYTRVTDYPAARAKLMEIARINAQKPPGFEGGKLLPEAFKSVDPTYYAGKVLDGLNDVVRMTLSDWHDRLASKGLVEDTATSKRDFINQSTGQYLKGAQNGLVAWLRDTGIGPFATAGTTYNVQGIKSLGLGTNVRAASWGADVRLRAEVFAKLAAVLGGTLAWNYAKWGRPDGDDKTPFLAMKLGEQNGKTLTMDLSPLVLVKRGLRNIGALSYIEAKRAGQREGVAEDRTALSAVNSLLHPAMGPAVNLAVEATTGHNTIGLPIAEKAHGDQSQVARNLVGAAKNVNPLISTALGAGKAKATPPEERPLDLLAPFGIRLRGSKPGGGRR